jgi:hypothetical protein
MQAETSSKNVAAARALLRSIGKAHPTTAELARQRPFRTPWVFYLQNFEKSTLQNTRGPLTISIAFVWLSH